nr:winged helix-turn-helix domain-containing protein [Streptomyces sp. SID3343]
MKMGIPDEDVLFGRWRRRTLRSLPGAVEPLRDVVPGPAAPNFLDVFSDTLKEGLETVRSARPALVRSEIERVYAGHPAPPPPWIRDLHRGDAHAWRVLLRAQHAAFDAVLRPVWPLVQDLHQAEFTRYALIAAEYGIGAALTALVPGSRFVGGVGGVGEVGKVGKVGKVGDVWEVDGPGEWDVKLCGRGVVLLPTFHWTGHPLVSWLPDRPLYVTFAAGPGLPPGPAEVGGGDDALAGVLGRTRLDILLLLANEHSTSDVARRLRVSNATVSTHTAALRGAGLITTVRAGRSVVHLRTALGAMLVRRRTTASPNTI